MINRLLPMLFILSLQTGCATHSLTIGAEGEEPNACTSSEDEFCAETDAQRAARNNQHGIEAAKAGKKEEALEYFTNAVELNDTVPEYLYNLSVAHSLLGDAAAEETALLEAVAIPTDDPGQTKFIMNAHYNLACLYAIGGHKDMAFEHLEKVAAYPDSNLDFHLIAGDEDLNNLRDDPRFKDVLERIGMPGSEKYPDMTGKPEAAAH